MQSQRIWMRPSFDDPALRVDPSVPFSVVIFGATGDLARKKLFPALYQLVLLGHFPRSLNIVGYGRSTVILNEFLEKQCVNVKEQPGLTKDEFKARITFHAGAYDSPDSFKQLASELTELEGGKPSNRLYFLAVPPPLFGVISAMINEHARAREPGFTRLIIEKPFGRDSETFEELDDQTTSFFHEEQIYRINHYVGKEVILNISTLRWANQLFEPTWNREFIESVQIVFKEDIGLGGRGGYFDNFGIIRDMMQNQLLQVMLWIAMDPPEDMSAAKIAEAKIELLRCIETLDFNPEECFLGQFGPSQKHPGYLDDETVPKDSRCPTFASLLLQVDNTRWRGVPFLMTAGKGLDERLCEVRVRYKQKPHNKLIAQLNGRFEMRSNELIMRIGPGEALFMTTTSKVPGLKFVPKSTVMDMSYDKQFKDTYVGDAYERLLLNAALGDRSLFVSADELVEMWRIFTPLLHQIDEKKPNVVLHPFGTEPTGWAEWATAKGVTPTEYRSMLPAPPPQAFESSTTARPDVSDAANSQQIPSEMDPSVPFSVVIFGATGTWLARSSSLHCTSWCSLGTFLARSTSSGMVAARSSSTSFLRSSASTSKSSLG